MIRLVAALLLTSIAGCSAPAEAPASNGTPAAHLDCDAQRACSTGRVCERGQCIDSCASDSECSVGEVCRAAVESSATVCREPVATAPADRYVVKLRSTTTDAENCVVPDPGPDIFGATLESPPGTIRGWAEFVWSEVQVDGNGWADASVLDGRPAPLQEDRCPDAYDDHVLALGCGPASFVLVRFVNSSGDPIALSPSRNQVVRVFEWGNQCTRGSLPDTVAVEVCTDSAAALSGDDASCTIPTIAGGSGELFGEI